MEKWLRNSISFTKVAATALALVTMVSSPVAQGAAAKANAKARTAAELKARNQTYSYNVTKKSIQEYMKFTGLAGKKPVTVGEFHSKMRPYYPKTLRGQLDRWAQVSRNEIMPAVQVTTYKDSSGKEQVRLLLSHGKQNFTLSYNPESEAKFLKINNVNMTKDDMMYHDQFMAKLIHGDKKLKEMALKAPKVNRLKKTIVLSYEEFSRLTPKQRAAYLVQVRYLSESAQKVMKVFRDAQALNEFHREFYVRWILGQEAYARAPKAGDPCIVAGYIAVYNRDGGSCGGPSLGRGELQKEMDKYGGGRCTGGEVSCNPLVYGLKNGQAICVQNGGRNSPIYEATSKRCNEQSPLHTDGPEAYKDKKRIIESYLETKGVTDLDLMFDKDGRISEEQYARIKDYLTELNAYVDKAIDLCNNPESALSKIRKTRVDQETACVGIATRKIEVLTYGTVPEAPPPKDCSIEKQGSVYDEKTGQCVCAEGSHDGTENQDGKERAICVANEARPPADTIETCTADQEPNPGGNPPCKDKCKFMCGGFGWLPVALGALAIGGLIWWAVSSSDDDDDKPKKPDPYDPCATAPSACAPPPAPPPVTPPPPPPVVPPGPTDPVPTPVVTPYVEPTNGSSTTTTGGTR